MSAPGPSGVARVTRDQPMPFARYKDLGVDAVDAARMAAFWALALGLQPVPGTTGPAATQWCLGGPTPQHRVRIDPVAGAKTAKHRLHLDVHGTDGASEAELVRAGATVLMRLPHWTVMADPEGGEFCLFERAHPPQYRLYEVCLDATDAAAQARWWARLFGVQTQSEDGDDWYWLTVPGAPFESLVVNPVPEPRTAVNRLRLDVYTADLAAVLATGATVLRAQDGAGRTVLADPEGNEFGAFVRADPGGHTG